MADEAENTVADPQPATRGNNFALEVCFLALIALVVVAAFFEALTYKLVSSRTPFVIMVPLIILIVIHGIRLTGRMGEVNVKARITTALSGGHAHFNKVVGISVWIMVLVGIITVFGHVAGIFIFCIIMMRFLAGESWKLTLLVSAGTAFFLWGLFEFLFNIDLYRGLILRYYLGFHDF